MTSRQEMEDLLDEMYNAFSPTPLQPGDPAYVDCRAVRGDEDVLEDLGRTVRRSQILTYQLYSGYRGSGKTTELLRLKKHLEDKGHVMVYFAADEEDLSVQDARTPIFCWPAPGTCCANSTRPTQTQFSTG